MHPRPLLASLPPVRPAAAPVPPGAAARATCLGLLLVLIGFAQPLWALATFALSSDLYSYILLIPVVSTYLAWQKRSHLPRPNPPARWLASGLLFGGGAVLGAWLVLRGTGVVLAPEDRLALTTTAFLLTFVGVIAWFLGRSVVAALAFPLGLLAFLVPLPIAAMTLVETGLQHGSAAVARMLFDLSGTAVFYQDLHFQLPRILLRVAPECSGIRSTMALIIVSLVAGYFFLRSPGRRAWLAFAVVPLALLRNGFRIFVIGKLCVAYGPQMIDSPLHHRGGPVFFALSLLPFFLLLFLLRRGERRAGSAPALQPPV